MGRSAAVIAGLLLVACGDGGSGGVAWDDPAGDAPAPKSRPDEPQLDIVRVEARGADGALRIKVRLKDSLEKRFAYVRPEGGSIAGVVAHLYLDTDNNLETGGHPAWGKETGRATMRGYDHRISLQLGYRYGEDASRLATAFGDVVVDRKKYKHVEALAIFGISKLRQGTSSIEFVRLPDGSRETAIKNTSWKGDTVEAAIPYAWIGLKGGETIRLCYYEREGAVAPDKGYSDDRLLKLAP